MVEVAKNCILSIEDVYEIDGMQDEFLKVKNDIYNKIKQFSIDCNKEFVAIGSSAAILNNLIYKQMTDIDIGILENFDKKELRSSLSDNYKIDILDWSSFHATLSGWQERIVDIDGIKVLSKRDMLVNMVCSLHKFNKLYNITAIINNDNNVVNQLLIDLETFKNEIKSSTASGIWIERTLVNIDVASQVLSNNYTYKKFFQN